MPLPHSCPTHSMTPHPHPFPLLTLCLSPLVVPPHFPSSPCAPPHAMPSSVQESDDLKDIDKSQLEELGAAIEESLFAVHKDVNHR